MKKLLFSFIILLSVFKTFAQGETSCNAIDITTNGTITCASFSPTSTYLPTVCVAGAVPSTTKSIWYKYTPTVNGEITISSNLPSNNGTTNMNNTRVCIFQPLTSCSNISCHDFNDDVSTTNLLSELTVPVQAFVTYYIQWDNSWNTTATSPLIGFQFTFNFNAVPCVRPSKYYFNIPTNIKTTSANINWASSIGNPSNYDIEWSTNFNDAAGSGTLVTFTGAAPPIYTNNCEVSNLPASSNIRYCIRSNCGSSLSSWQGPRYIFLAVPLPYSNNFDSAANNYLDGFSGFPKVISSATSIPANYADGGAGVSLTTSNSTTAVSNLWLYSRAISLSAGETVTIKFKTRLYSATTASPMTLALNVGSAQTSASQTTAIQTFNITDSSAYTQQTATWTVPSTGIYHFGINNNSPVGSAQTKLFLDTLEFTSALSTTEFLDSKFSVSPNPANDFINISNADNTSVNAISITDLNGRVVKQNKYSNVTNVQVNVFDLASGVYMMSISSDKGVVTKKIIKS
jgi:hypothetical protein